jgi:pyrroline-5-carboxylate reductase
MKIIAVIGAGTMVTELLIHLHKADEKRAQRT